MSRRDRFDYLSALDPAYTSSLWPHKGLLDVRASQAEEAKRIERIFRMNLVWRPSILLRHIDLFNTIPLLQFMKTEQAAALCQAHLLDVAIPDDGTFTELFENWALRGSSQHWHHLSGEEQESYDDLFAAGKIESISDVENAIHFSDFDIDLQQSLRQFGSLFHSRRIILKTAPSSDWYSKRVMQRWNEFVDDSRNYGRRSTAHRDAVTHTLELGVKEQWRRRRYFTELDRIEQELNTAKDKYNVVLEAKLAAVNTAFYDELEECRLEKTDRRGPISVLRDITPLQGIPTGPPGKSDLDITLCDDLQPLDSISLKDLAAWHTSDDPESRAFQESVRSLHRFVNAGPGRRSQAEIHRAVNHHVTVLNACITRTERRRGDQAARRGTLVQLLWPEATVVAHQLTGATLGLLSVAAPAMMHADKLLQTAMSYAIGTVALSAVTICFAIPTRNAKWRQAECMLKSYVEDSLVGSGNK